ncbi:AI-2E family transporter [Lachnospiraceae bacterium]|jgi:predicted PurR-regulated permease PerM|nr:AI-2E family transporter [uncultured Schaedlerella sp.]MCI9152702.1 AI-2E family transporter [Ruminococcus sp.]NBI59417.1 AI-2E family transporter [Lachnospiraceae bacterium]
MDLNKENMRKIKELIVFTIVILIALWKYTLVVDFLGFILNIIFPFLLGGAIAFILNVPMSFLESKIFGNKNIEGRPAQKFARPCSLTLTILGVIGIIALVMFVVIPQLGSTFVGLGKTIQDFTPVAMAWIEELFHNNQEIMTLLEDFNMDWDKILDGFAAFFKNGAGSVLDTTMSAAKSIISSVTTFFIAFVFSCYILLQKEKLRVQVQKIFYAYLPKKIVEKALDICSLTYRTFASFLAGQCVEALILGMMFLVTMWILRLPYALLVGVLIAFTALIPIFGAFIGCIVGAFLILMVNPVKAITFVAMFLVLQQVEGNLIYPKVVGNSVGLPSIWVLAAVSIGGSLMGVVGMLVFIPLVSVVYILFRGDVYKRLEKKGIELE